MKRKKMMNLKRIKMEDCKMDSEKWDGMTDSERWKWIIANPDFGTVQLDNDQTSLESNDRSEDNYACYYFRDSVGNQCEVLLEVMGIKGETV